MVEEKETRTLGRKSSTLLSARVSDGHGNQDSQTRTNKSTGEEGVVGALLIGGRMSRAELRVNCGRNKSRMAIGLDGLAVIPLTATPSRGLRLTAVCHGGMHAVGH